MGEGAGEPLEPASEARNPERHRAGVGVARPWALLGPKVPGERCCCSRLG